MLGCMESIGGVWECYGDVGIVPQHGILTNKKSVPPTVDVS